MCGKFTQMASWAEVHEYADLFGASVNDQVRVFIPMRAVPVVHLKNQKRIITPMTWGYTDRKTVGPRRPKHMHARGETVDQLPTFREAFRYRRGITFARTFNEGKEIPIVYDDGSPTDRDPFTQQWTIRPKDGKPIIIGVVYDCFDVGKGDEYEFVQVTTPANALISTITDRMPLLLREQDLGLWLGETSASLEEIKALIETREFDTDDWEMFVEDPAKKPPRPKKSKPKAPPQDTLF